MKLCRSGNGLYVEDDGSCYRVPMPFRDALVAHGDPYGYALFRLSP